MSTYRLKLVILAAICVPVSVHLLLSGLHVAVRITAAVALLIWAVLFYLENRAVRRERRDRRRVESMAAHPAAQQQRWIDITEYIDPGELRMDTPECPGVVRSLHGLRSVSFTRKPSNVPSPLVVEFLEMAERAVRARALINHFYLRCLPPRDRARARRRMLLIESQRRRHHAIQINHRQGQPSMRGLIHKGKKP